MDLSLHSFILVVGLVVMAFILWDGIKKVKQSRANRLRIKLDDQFDQLGSESQFGSEFPNGGGRSAHSVVAGMDDDLHADKYDELEFDDNLVGAESLSTKESDSETYVTAELLNDVEQELEQMDAVSQTDSNADDLTDHLNSTTRSADDEPAVAQNTHTVLPELPSTAESSTLDQTKPLASLQSDKQTDQSMQQDEAKHMASAGSEENNRHADQPTESDEARFDFKAALSDIQEEEPLQFQMTAKTRTDSETTDTQSAVATKSFDEQASKQAATAKAEKLKAELAKITEAKKQLAAKQADQKREATAEVPSQQSHDDLTPVPMLMEPVALGDTIDPHPPEQKELTLPEQVEPERPEPTINAQADADSEWESFSALDDDEALNTVIDPLLDDVPASMVEHTQVGERLKDRPIPQEVLVINVLKDKGQPLQGRDLNTIFKACDLRHGEMDIFHRFEQANAKGKIQFSVANGVEPGTFDPATIDESTTTGISFFMSLPGPEHPMEAFDAMVEVAHVFARNFNAELHDESHSDLTPQTIEHCRHRIREFCRKQKMNTASV